MQEVKQLKRHIITISIALIALLAATLGSSYAAYFRSKTTSGVQNIKTGIVNLVRQVSVYNGKLQVMNDTDGRNQAAFAGTNVRLNTSNLEASYYLNFLYQGASGDIVIPLEYINVQMQKGTSSTNYTNFGNVINLGDCPMRAAGSTVANAYATSVYFFYKSSNTNTLDRYRFKFWLREDTPPEYLAYLDDIQGLLRVNVYGVASASERYKINIKTTSGTETINILNGSLTGTLTTSGTTFDLIPGSYTYTLGSYLAEGETDPFVLKIQRGNTLSLTRPDYVSATTPIFKYAFDNNRTINSLLYHNNCTANSIYCTADYQTLKGWNDEGDAADPNWNYYELRTYVLTIPTNYPVQMPINLTLETTGTNYKIGRLTLDQ